MGLRGRRIHIFLESLCLLCLGGLDIWVLSTSFQKSNIGQPQQPPTEKLQKYVFQNFKILLKSRLWMTLKSSAVIFQALKPLQPQWLHWPLQPLLPNWSLQPCFIKGHPDPDGWIIPGTKMIKTGPFFWNESSKIHFSLISDTLGVGGCWGHLILLFWKLVNKTQMSTSPEHTKHHDSRKLSILLPLRAIYFSTFQYETPCTYSQVLAAISKLWCHWCKKV